MEAEDPSKLKIPRRPKRSDLTEKEWRFVHLYALTGNATQSYRHAGYKGAANVCAVTGHRMLRKPKIAAELDRVFDRIREEADFTLADLVGFYEEIVFTPISHVDEDSWMVEEKRETYGEEGELRSCNLKMISKQFALQQIGKLTGLDRDSLNGEVGDTLLDLIRDIRGTAKEKENE